MTDYTHTTKHVRQAYSTAWDQVTPPDDVELVREQAQIEFDRWYANEIRKAKEQAWEEGLLSAGLDPDYTMQIMSTNPYTEES